MQTNHLTIRLGTVADAEQVEAVHWAGLERAYLGRVDVNERARLFYESLGFRFDGTTRPNRESKAPVAAHRYFIEIGSGSNQE